MFKYAEVLKACRKRSGFTQADIASVMGVSLNTIGNWESEKCIPNVMDFERLLNVYGLTIKIALKEEMERKEVKRW